MSQDQRDNLYSFNKVYNDKFSNKIRKMVISDLNKALNKHGDTNNLYWGDAGD